MDNLAPPTPTRSERAAPLRQTVPQVAPESPGRARSSTYVIRDLVPQPSGAPEPRGTREIREPLSYSESDIFAKSEGSSHLANPKLRKLYKKILQHKLEFERRQLRELQRLRTLLERMEERGGHVDDYEVSSISSESACSNSTLVEEPVRRDAATSPATVSSTRGTSAKSTTTRESRPVSSDTQLSTDRMFISIAASRDVPVMPLRVPEPRKDEPVPVERRKTQQPIAFDIAPPAPQPRIRTPESVSPVRKVLYPAAVSWFFPVTNNFDCPRAEREPRHAEYRPEKARRRCHEEERQELTETSLDSTLVNDERLQSAYDAISDEQRALEQLSLQEALSALRPSFIARSNARVCRISQQAEQRRARATAHPRRQEWIVERRRPLIAGYTHSGLRMFDDLRPKLSSREIRERTKKAYRILPEVVQRNKDKERREFIRNNRNRVAQFNKKVQSSALRSFKMHKAQTKLRK